jgi:hypothetical protein
MQVLAGGLITIALAFSSFALHEIYDMHGEILLLQKEVQHEQRVTRTLKMHWRILRWDHDHINIIRDKLDLAPARWPDIGDRP